MNAIISLFAATLVAAADILALVLLVKNLGRKLNFGKAAALAFFLMLKLALLGLAVFWMAKAPWFDAAGAVAGLTFPFAALVLILALKNTRRDTASV